MKIVMALAGVLVSSVLATGCVATHKYVAKTIAPLEQRVSDTEGKNTDQDKQLATHETQIAELDRDASRTKEKLNDTDAKATQAGQAAAAADQKAMNAQQSADGAKQSADGAQRAADGAKTFAEQGLNRLDQNMQALTKYHVDKTETILFDFNQSKLTDEAKAQLDALGKEASGMDRYVIELRGFTDKSGDASYNETLSAERAQVVARYLVNQHEIPLHNVSMLGSGYAKPVADDTTREGRKMNRRVEVKLWIPENPVKTVAASGSGE